MRPGGHKWSSPELGERVQQIIADRDRRRDKLIAWQQAEMPDKSTSDAEWKKVLDPMEFNVLRGKGTEPRGGEYDGFYPDAQEGFFACRGCQKPLYSAAAKFKSGCGWPAFDKCYKNSVEITVDESHGMQRIEITCAGCDGHLGHVFAGERMTPTNERHCVNSVSVRFVKGAPPAGVTEAGEEGVTTMEKLAQVKKLQSLLGGNPC